jgi:hypothetical protein
VVAPAVDTPEPAGRSLELRAATTSPAVVSEQGKTPIPRISCPDPLLVSPRASTKPYLKSQGLVYELG